MKIYLDGKEKDKIPKKQEIYSIGKIKISIYLSQNSTFEEILKTRMLPLYEKIICDCENDYGGLFCEIPLVKKDWFTDMSTKLYQNNMRSIIKILILIFH